MTPEEIRWREGCGALVLGNYADGFQWFESRMDIPSADCVIPRSRRWRGEEGKNVLLITEGGIGDAIFFMRYLPFVKERCRKVGLDCSSQPALASLIPAWVSRDLQGPWDYLCSLQSLPAVFHTGPDTLPSPFNIELNESKLKNIRLDNCKDMWVGVRWSGNPSMSANVARSMSYEQFRGLFAVQGVNYVSLYEKANRQTRPPLIDFDLKDLAHSAALISQLDLVITVDTSVAHLAASLGRPTWILVPRIEAYWIWGLEGTTTPWYPSARLVRQGRAEEWEDTMERVQKILTILVAKWRAKQENNNENNGKPPSDRPRQDC